MASNFKPWTQRPTKRYRLVDCSLLDPKDGQIYEHVTLDLKGGAIVRMTKLQKWPSPGDEVLSWTQDEQVTIVNVQGKWVVPGESWIGLHRYILIKH